MLVPLNPMLVGPSLVSLLALSRPIRMAAPEIDWQDGVVASNEAVADSKATRQLSIRATTPLEYKPGHILGLGFSHDGVDLKGPYTVTRSSDIQLDVVYRIIPDGRKTPLMASMEAGAAVRFGGKFGTPIEDGVAPGVDRVVGIATGAGLAPLVGYAERALRNADGPRIELFGGFASLADICCAKELDALAEAHPSKFSWTACISKPMACTAVTSVGGARASGRVTRSVPPLLRTTRDTHFHLIGNGAFVKEFKAGCLEAGVPEERVTTEIYFNGKAEPDPDVVSLVAIELRKLDAQVGAEVAVVSMG
jgi:ferredoxin-NADP reductase